MRTVSSAEVQKNFGAFREAVAAEPVLVQHYGQPSIVMLSVEEYNRLEHFPTKSKNALIVQPSPGALRAWPRPQWPLERDPT